MKLAEVEFKQKKPEEARKILAEIDRGKGLRVVGIHVFDDVALARVERRRLLGADGDAELVDADRGVAEHAEEGREPRRIRGQVVGHRPLHLGDGLGQVDAAEAHLGQGVTELARPHRPRTEELRQVLDRGDALAYGSPGVGQVRRLDQGVGETS